MIGTIIAKKAVYNTYRYLNSRDLAAFLADWQEDATFTYPGNLSVSGEIKRKGAIIDWFTRFLDQFPKINIALKHVCLENPFDLSGTNVISAEYDNTVTNKDGHNFVYRGVSVITIKKGKTVSVRDYIFDLNDDFRSAWGEG